MSECGGKNQCFEHYHHIYPLIINLKKKDFFYLNFKLHTDQTKKTKMQNI